MASTLATLLATEGAKLAIAYIRGHSEAANDAVNRITKIASETEPQPGMIGAPSPIAVERAMHAVLSDLLEARASQLAEAAKRRRIEADQAESVAASTLAAEAAKKDPNPYDRRVPRDPR